MADTEAGVELPEITESVVSFLPHVGRARLRGPATPNPTPGVTVSFTASLETSDGKIVPLAYVKDLTPKELLGELLGATLGHSLQLPLAEAFAVVATDAQGPWRHAPKISGSDDRLLFATSAISYPKTLFVYVQDMQLLALQRLAAWKGMPAAVALDEWIANVDRHAGNLLVSGSGDFWLIDHSHVLTGSTWDPPVLKTQEATAFANQLAVMAATGMSVAERIAARNASQQDARSHGLIDLDKLFACFPVSKLLPGSDLSVAREFLANRCGHTNLLLANRF